MFQEFLWGHPVDPPSQNRFFSALRAPSMQNPKSSPRCARQACKIPNKFSAARAKHTKPTLCPRCARQTCKNKHFSALGAEHAKSKMFSALRTPSMRNATKSPRCARQACKTTNSSALRAPCMQHAKSSPRCARQACKANKSTALRSPCMRQATKSTRCAR